MRNLEVTGRVLSKEMTRQLGGKDHSIAVLSDETGTIRLHLWRGQVDQVNAGDTIRLKSAFARSFMQTLELSTWEESIEVLSRGSVGESFHRPIG